MNKKDKILLPVLLAVLSIGGAAAAQPANTDSLVYYPWAQQLSYYQSTGSCLTIGEEELEKRTLGDLRGRLTGMVPGLDVTEKQGSFRPLEYSNSGLSGSSYRVYLRGLSNPICIVDDIYIPFSQLSLDPNQIESVTLLADVLDMAKYGPFASDGAVLIRTKKGGYNTPMRIRFDAEAGVAMTDRVAEWVNGEEYARLNNAAREVAGYQQQYGPEALEGIARRDAYDMQYPNVDYKSLMYKPQMPVSRIGINLDGGGNRVKYNLSLNGFYNGDIVKNMSDHDFTKLNATASLTAKVGRWIEVGANFATLLSFRRSGRAAWYSYRSVPAVAFPLTLGNSLGDDDARFGSTIYGVSRTFTQNYYALGLEGGFRTERNRSGMITTSIDIDLSKVAKGLKSRTLFGLTNYVQTTIGKNNDYLGYYWTAAGGIGDISTHKATKASSKSTLSSYTMQSLSLYERLSYDWEGNGHRVAAGATFVINNNANASNAYHQRQLYTMLDGSYSYRKRYIAEFVLQYAGSSRFDRDHRFAFFPSGGLAWVASQEPFLREVKWIDNLKIHAQAGIIGASNLFSTPYLYRADYSGATNGMWLGPNSKQDSWFGVNRWITQSATMNRLANHDLTWSTLFQVNVGVDFDFLNGFSLKADFQRRFARNGIANVSDQIPAVFGLSSVDLYKNFTKVVLRGADLSLGYARTFGEVGFSVRLDGSIWETVNTKLVSDDYLYDYQKKTGRASDVYWGFKCLGKYETYEQIATLPSYSATPQIGDLIYQDMNDDGKIDTNDRIVLAHTQPRLRYAVNLGFSYRNFELQVVGTGHAFHKTAMTNDYFWNGWGDGNYSAFVRDNIGGAYPRLDYVKSDNNFVASDFWLRDGGWFKIQDAELAYTLAFRKSNKVGIRSIRFSLRGQNLATISGIKDVDPEAIDAGVTSYPLFKTFTAGVKFNF